MMRRCILLVLAFLLLGCEAGGDLSLPICGNVSKFDRSWNLSINSTVNETGDWETVFSAWEKSSNPSNNISLSLFQRVFECDGNQIVHIHGVMNGLPFDYDNQSFHFHPHCGSNVAISNDGRSAQKINSSSIFNGIVFSDRPLKHNEMFEVTLGNRNTSYYDAWGIGLTIYPPETINIPETMDYLDSGNWMMYHDVIYINGTRSLFNYGSNLDKLKAGDRIGVMRNNYGALHFFFNGVDQGPAASNIPYPVYGVFELWAGALNGTIVDNTK